MVGNVSYVVKSPGSSLDQDGESPIWSEMVKLGLQTRGGVGIPTPPWMNVYRYQVW